MSSASSPGARRRAPPRSRSGAARAWSAGAGRRATGRPSPRPRGRGAARGGGVGGGRASGAALIQGGATGPRLEAQLREHGLTLRHFPQSFEYSTLGGWIATRAGGHFATLYTHIDDLVESIRAVTLDGEWESRRLP